MDATSTAAKNILVTPAELFERFCQTTNYQGESKTYGSYPAFFVKHPEKSEVLVLTLFTKPTDRQAVAAFVAEAGMDGFEDGDAFDDHIAKAKREHAAGQLAISVQKESPLPGEVDQPVMTITLKPAKDGARDSGNSIKGLDPFIKGFVNEFLAFCFRHRSVGVLDFR